MKPVILKQDNDNTEYGHPAFGLITMTIPTGGSGVLFGSDLKHHSRIHITLSEATQQRHLNKDWNQPGKKICDFEMSHAQFAQFITSAGNGGGTPVTLKYHPLDGDVPVIDEIETKSLLMKKEVSESTRRAFSDINFEIERLGNLLNSGKIGKKDIADIHRMLTIRMSNAIPNMEYVITQGQKTLEKAISDAKIEIETYVQLTAQRLGFETMDQLRQLELKKE